MPKSNSWFWGTSKQSAYTGWFITVFGGAGIGAGVAILYVTRLLTEIAGKNNISFDPILFADVQLFGTVLIFIGLFGCIFGILAIHNSMKTVNGKSMVSVSMEKKFCRYCGTENKSDAAFCEKCGKKINA